MTDPQCPYVGFRKAEFMGFLQKVHEVMNHAQTVIFPEELVQSFEKEYDGTMYSVYQIVEKINQAKALERAEYHQFFTERYKEKEQKKKSRWWRRG